MCVHLPTHLDRSKNILIKSHDENSIQLNQQRPRRYRPGCFECPVAQGLEHFVIAPQQRLIVNLQSARTDVLNENINCHNNTDPRGFLESVAISQTVLENVANVRIILRILEEKRGSIARSRHGERSFQPQQEVPPVYRCFSR